VLDATDSTLLTALPVELLHAELRRRQESPYKPSCGSTGNRGFYNTPVHVAAVFLILGLSTLGQAKQAIDFAFY